MPNVFEKIIFLDIETDGLDTQKDQITQIAMVGVVRDEIVGKLEIKLKFNDKIGNQEALQQGHYDPALWAKEAISFPDAAKIIDKFIQKYKWVLRTGKTSGKTYSTCMMGGHNIFKFDGPFLRRVYQENDLFCPFDFSVGYDSYSDLCNFCSKSGRIFTSLKMESLCEEFGIVNQLPHHALYDAISSVELSLKIHEMIVKYYGQLYSPPVNEEIIMPDVIDI